MTVSTADLATYLNDGKLDADRAQHFIDRAVSLCQTVVSPLPAGADVVVERVAARAYVTTVSSRQAQLADAGSPFGGTPTSAGGVYLTQTDRRDLRQMSGGGSAFSISMLPAGYTLTQPWWDSATVGGDWDSPI